MESVLRRTWRLAVRSCALAAVCLAAACGSSDSSAPQGPPSSGGGGSDASTTSESGSGGGGSSGSGGSGGAGSSSGATTDGGESSGGGVDGGTGDSGTGDGIDWPTYMAQNDPVWGQLPQTWESGAFTGNGLLGANITVNPVETPPPYATPAAGVRWHIGRTDIHPGNTNRVQIGDFVLAAPGPTGDMRIDLWNAQATGHITTSAGTIAVTSFTHFDQIVQVIQITPDAGTKNATFTWQPGVPYDTTTKTAGAAPSETQSTMGNVHLSVRAGVCTTAWTEVAGANGSRVEYVTVGAAVAGKDDGQTEAIANINQAVSTGYDALVASHQAWWHSFWQQSFLSIPDTKLESFYWIQLYTMGSASRSGRPVLDLLGPWYRYTPWGHLWWDLNVQLTYWIQLASNHLDLGQPLVDVLWNDKAQLAANAGQYSADSYAIGGHSSGFDLKKSIGTVEVNNLTWALHNVYLQYRYSMDDTMLQNQLLPLLKGAINYDLHVLKMQSDGKLHMPIGWSPEYPAPQPSPDPDANYELSLIRWGCQTLLDITTRLKISDPLIPQWTSTLANLLPPPTDTNGYRISATIPFALSHRHYSHMFMAFPLYLADPGDAANETLISTSLKWWESLPSAWEGFSYSGASSISALLGNGDDAQKYLDELLAMRIQPNTFYEGGGPSMETPLSAGRSVHDMLLSSWGNKIRIFPAVPAAWTEIAFRDLRTEGAFLVSAVRKGGAVQFIRISSLAGEPCTLVTDMPSPAILSGGAGDTIAAGTTGEYTVTMSKGDVVVITPGGKMVDQTIAP